MLCYLQFLSFEIKHFHLILHQRNIQILISFTASVTKLTGFLLSLLSEFWVTFHMILHQRNVLILIAFSPSQCLHVLSFIQFYLWYDPSLLQPQSLHAVLCCIQFLSFEIKHFHMILYQRNIQILLSFTASVTKLTCCLLSLVSEFWDLPFIWSYIIGTFNYYFLSLLLPQSVHAVLSSVSEFWD